MPLKLFSYLHKFYVFPWHGYNNMQANCRLKGGGFSSWLIIFRRTMQASVRLVPFQAIWWNAGSSYRACPGEEATYVI